MRVRSLTSILSASISIVAVAIFSLGAHAMLIPPFFVNSVVAIGSVQTISIPGQPSREEWQTEGTGFFYGHLVKNDPDPQKRAYEIYLVTAKHVIQKHRQANRSDLQIRINPKDPKAPVQQFQVPDNPPAGAATWYFHPNKKIDIAVVRVNFEELNSLGYEPNFFADDLTALPK
jgi:hypothetical protein